MTLGDVLAQLSEHLYGLWPFRIVNAWEQAVKLRCGRIRGLLKPGLHFFWPFLEEITTQEANVEVVSTPHQTCTTSDGKVVTFNLVIRYRTVDLAKQYATIHDAGETILAEVCASAGAWAPELTAEEANAELADDVWGDIQERFAEWGLELEAITLANFAVVQAIRLIGERS